MIGVRLLSRGSGAFRTDIARCLIVCAALCAQGVTPIGRSIAHAGTKADAEATDPFLEEDTQPPSADEIPPVPEQESKPNSPLKKGTVPLGRADTSRKDSSSERDSPLFQQDAKPEKPKTPAIPTMDAPRLPREIKDTKLPQQGSAAELDSELPPLPSKKVQLPETKHQPLEGRSGWKSAGAPPAGGRKTAPGLPNDPESARFEKGKEVDPEELEKPLAAIMVEGNKTIQTDEIRKLIKSRPGRPADRKQIKEDIAILVSKRWFYSVEPRIAHSSKGPVLVFRVSEKPVLQKVTYTGNKKIKEKELSELTNLKVGGGYDVNQNRESARRIESHYQEKGYLHAKVTLEKGDSPHDREVVFKIEEGPKVVVSKITFSGNKFVSGPVLKTQVKTKTQILWLFGGKYDPVSIPEDIRALKTYYQNLGFFDVKVKAIEATSEDKGRVHIEYAIEEGVRYKVRNIEFNGNRVIAKEKLRENMKMKTDDYFNERWVSADKDKIIGQYGELGRILAKVEYFTRTHEEPGSVDLVYNINEDRPYRIGKINVRINGSHPHTKESVVLTKLLFKPGDLANQSLINKSEQRLKNTQVFASGQPGQQNSQQNDPPHISVIPSEIKVARRGSNLARGQDGAYSPTSNSRPARRATSRPASPPADPPPSVFDSPTIGPDLGPGLDSETADPFGFSLFRGQDAGPDPNGEFVEDEGGPLPMPLLDEPPGYMDANISVSETQTGRINFGVGVNSNAGLVGNAVLEENNFDLFRPPRSLQDVIDGTAFRGGGQQFRIEAMPGLQSSLSGSYAVSRYVVSWRDPYFLDQNISFGVSGSYYNRFFPNWFEQRAGGRVTLGRQFTPYWSGSVAIRAENVDITNPSFPTPPAISSVLGNNFLSTVMATVAHDTRDSPFLPGKGHYIDVNYEQGMANFVFPKVTTDIKQYFLVRERPDGGNRHVIALSGTVGWTGDQTPFFERFFAGGFTNFRGFQFYGVTPRVNGVRVGGNWEFLGSAEYLMPLTADNMFQVVGFTDFGTVDSTVTMDAFRITVGGGIRVSVPMMGPVPLAIDFAVPLRREPFDTTQVISFWFGLLR